MNAEQYRNFAERYQSTFLNIKEYYDKNVKSNLQLTIIKRASLVREQISRLKSVQGYEKSSILKPYVEEIETFYEKYNSVANGLDKPFMLFVMGMGKYGKSTLLNALMRSNEAAMDELPKTWKIDVFNPALPAHCAVVKYKDNRKQLLKKDEVKELILQEEKKRDESDELVSKEFKQKSKSYKTIAEKKEFKQYLEEKLVYKSDVIEVEWGVKRTPILKHFSLVDTPGIFQNIMGELRVSIQEYYHKADGVIWMLNAEIISAAKSKELLEELNTHLDTIGNKKATNIIAVLNRIDKIRERSGEEGVERIIKEAKDIYGDIFSDIIPISAFEALKGIENNDNKQIERSGMEKLEYTINHVFFQNSRRLQMESKINAITLLDKELNILLTELYNRLYKDHHNRIKSLLLFDSEIAEKMDTLKKRIQTTIAAYKNEVKDNIYSRAGDLFDIDSESKRQSYLEKDIFRVQKISQQMGKLQKDIFEEIVSIEKLIKPKITFSKYKHIDITELENKNLVKTQSSVAFNNHTLDTDDISFASGAGISIVAALLLGPLGLILGPLLAHWGFTKWIAKQFKLGEVQSNLLSTLNASTEEMQEKMEEELMTRIEIITDNIYLTCNETFSSLYGNSETSESVLDVLKNWSNTISQPVQALSVKEIIIQSHTKKESSIMRR
ncbi:dynamin family protein [Bacillus alkalisoli]|uniref:dynamin family protein n=1 Tax=Bacillus alkalisoli TaxID=2011008 RepID=UPI000C236BBF|nr:dynamin family protein [Bacillus alkalisoli]